MDLHEGFKNSMCEKTYMRLEGEVSPCTKRLDIILLCMARLQCAGTTLIPILRPISYIASGDGIVGRIRNEDEIRREMIWRNFYRPYNSSSYHDYRLEYYENGSIEKMIEREYYKYKNVRDFIEYTRTNLTDLLFGMSFSMSKIFNIHLNMWYDGINNRRDGKILAKKILKLVVKVNNAGHINLYTDDKITCQTTDEIVFLLNNTFGALQREYMNAI
jgi:hypothetical protein